MTIRRGIPPLLVPLLLLAAVGGCTSDEPAGVELADVRRAPVTEVVEAPATVGARATATLRAPAPGTLAKLYVREGEQVRKGELLARIRSPQAEGQLKQARQAARLASPAAPRLASPQVRLASFDTRAFDAKVGRHFARARQEARRIRDAQARKQLLGAIDLAEAQHRAQTRALASITAQLNRSINSVLSGVTSGFSGLAGSMASLQAASRTQAKAAVKAAEGTVASLTIRAPFSGVVTLGRASGGGGSGGLDGLLSQIPGGGQQLPSLPSSGGSGTPVATGVPVSAGDSIVTVTDVSRLTLSADIDETDVLLVKKGTRATVELDAVPGAGYTGRVTGVGVTPKEGTTGGVSYPVQLSLGAGTFDDGGAAPTPKPGMSAVARLTVRESPSAVSVPASAIVSSGRESVVWAVRDGLAERRVVKLGAQGEAAVEVLGGLSVGERVVVKGADSVRPGQRLP
ncbi:efflux RND transporter periplasmic adaptor subunit [Nonomuraea roseoviolacea]|uniref:Multidrug efflux pump subunit AcrA (Membrane-fusion protein) n=1 Tax=Nonomuraea roseoviolacea subsp. carminata TaxID=160689 RepID=A0ABT1JYL7_9ACTN|nr:HlyD family efflux transporter periplasmic adaptor subunit [Nonomuraea roseoviolacea]MCP2346847.1 multidrug efflux pump subunit AcrA (membrane-fusion protein) [Nonomuraea roseoviolacea subsp. carminata]